MELDENPPGRQRIRYPGKRQAAEDTVGEYCTVELVGLIALFKVKYSTSPCILDKLNLILFQINLKLVGIVNEYIFSIFRTKLLTWDAHIKNLKRLQK